MKLALIFYLHVYENEEDNDEQQFADTALIFTNVPKHLTPTAFAPSVKRCTQFKTGRLRLVSL